MSEQLGWRAFTRHVRDEAPYWGALLPQLPRLLHRRLADDQSDMLADRIAAVGAQQSRQTRWLMAVSILACHVAGRRTLPVLGLIA